MKKLLLLFFCYFTLFSIYAQNTEWILFSNGDNVYSTVFDEDNVWVGTNGGLVKLNKTTGEKTFYNTFNSGLPNQYVINLTIDVSGNKWIGTYQGLAKFNGTNWTIYNIDNSGLPDDYISSLAIDESGNKWIGTYQGLAKFNGTNWTIYNISNSGLPDNIVTSIAIDGSGNKWIGTYYSGLAKFDGTNWTVYNTSNSGLPADFISSLAIDGSGNKWIGTDGGGLAKFNGTNWTVYNTSNSGLRDNRVLSLAIDVKGNKWIGTTGEGLAVYKEGGVVSVEDDKLNIFLTNFFLSQNYPNPFNPTTTINYSVPRTSFVTIKVYDALGREIETLVNSGKIVGNYSVRFNANKLSSGVYFYRMQAGDFVQTKKLIMLK